MKNPRLLFRSLRPRLVAGAVVLVAVGAARPTFAGDDPPPPKVYVRGDGADAPLVEVLFPEPAVTAAPAAPARDVAAPPRRTPAEKPRRDPYVLAAGGGVVASGLGAGAVGSMVLDMPTIRSVAVRAWALVPMSTHRIDRDGGVSEARPWMAGLGVAKSLTDARAPVVVRLHVGWGCAVLNVRAVEARPGSGLRPHNGSADLFTLLGQAGVDVSFRLAERLRLGVGATAGTTLTSLVVEHDREAGEYGASFGVPYGGLELRMEVPL